MSNRGKFYGLGVGPGDPRLLTLRAVEVLKIVDVVAIPKSRLDRESVAWEIAKEHCSSKVRLLEIELPMTADKDVLDQAWKRGAEVILQEIRAGNSVAFITLGDPSLYSTYGYLLSYLRYELPEQDIETVPGVTAMCAAAARVNWPLAMGDEPLLVLPGTGFTDHLDIPNLVLLKVSRNLPEVLDTLAQQKRDYVLLTRVGQANEGIKWRPQKHEVNEDIDYLSLILVKKNSQD